MNKKIQGELITDLINKNLITSEQADRLRKTIENSFKSVDDLLIKENIIKEEQLCYLKAGLYQMLYKNLLDKKVKYEILNIISEEVAKNYKIICFDKKEKFLKMGIVDPDDMKAMEAVNFIAKKENFEVEYYLISESSFLKVFKQYKDFQKEISIALQSKVEEDKNKNERKRDDATEEIIKSAPVAKIVSVIIRHAVEGGASDIHIEPSQKEVRVRYRIDGILHTSLVLPNNVHSAIISRIKVMAGLKLDETRIPQDGRIRLNFGGKGIDFRISVLPLVGAEKIVMRILDVSKGAPTLEELGYYGRSAEILLRSTKSTSGMCLITGPTGSGKSTTLFSILNILNKEGVNISTLEDPVEYFIQGINQSQTKPEIGYSFATGLRSLLRQDPDIIMVGEIRDKETAELAIHASLTGHYLLSTLHTRSALGAIPRLLDMEVEPFLLGSTLNIIIAQRLVRKICTHCKQEEIIPVKMLKEIEEDIKNMPSSIIDENKDINLKEEVEKLKFYKGSGCPRCGNTGFKGRMAIVEILEVNKKIQDFIMNQKILNLEDVLESQNFITMKQDGLIKTLRGETTLREVFRVIRD